jgi:glucose/mannose transport system substrate-binding protein
MDLHRLNWLWYNRAVLAKAGITAPPQSWKELLADLAKVKAKGIIPMAGGGNGWMIATEFDPIALETGGPAWYREVFVKLDPQAINSPTMVKALERLRQIEAYTPKSLAGRTWNYDTGLVAHGQAAFQIMGDWANGQFEFLGVTPGGPKVGCVAFPGTAKEFIYNVDSFIFFRQHNPAQEAAVVKLAETMTSPKFQLLFNKYKGSIPDLMNVSLKGYNPCQQKSRVQFLEASKDQGLVPSFSQNMSTYGPTTGAFIDSLDQFYTSNESPQAAAAAMAKRVEVAKSQD